MTQLRTDFAAFILTHGRPDRVRTYDALRRSGYTGKIFIVIDDEDQTSGQYRSKFGDDVLMFSKAKIASQFDEGDNLDSRRCVFYARNACFDLARQVGVRYFIQLDDDYGGFYLRHDSQGRYVCYPLRTTLDDVLEAMLDFFIGSPCLSIAMSQGGEHLGGGEGAPLSLRRKAMNSFICDTERPFTFTGRINEDVNTYTNGSLRGDLFFTVMTVQLNQTATQTNGGGMTQLYLDFGTYVKSFFSVMYCPSGVKIGEIGDHRMPHYRIHHAINWNVVAPKILREEHRKASRRSECLSLPPLSPACLPLDKEP